MKRLLTIRLLWASILIGLVSFFGLFILAGNGTFGEMPQFEQLENPNTNLATQIISSDGEILVNIILMTTERLLLMMNYLKI